MESDSSPSVSEQDAPPVHSQLQDEIDDSEYQVLRNITMDEGKYNQPSTYKKVEVLLLCWAQNSNDLKTEREVKKLESILQTRFRYGTHIAHLDNDLEQKLQVQLNAKVAHFVGEHDGTNTLLVVYYAGHGRPGKFYGDLEMFGYVDARALLVYDVLTLAANAPPKKGKSAWTLECGIKQRNFSSQLKQTS